MLSLSYVALDSLRAADRNPKRHHADVEASLARFGLGEHAGVVDGRTGRLLAGHGRVEALRALQRRGAAAPGGVDVRAGVWFVPVLQGWASKDDREAEALLLALNELTRAGGWNTSELEAVLKDLGETEAAGLGFDAELLASLFGSSETEDEEDEEGEPEEPEHVWVKEGETYALGAHRLHVGDSLTKEGRAVLFGDTRHADAVITDPPYAIFGSSSGIGRDIADDKMVRPFFDALFSGVVERLKWTGHLYCFTDWRSWAMLWNALKLHSTLVPKNGLVWSKGGSGLGSNYAMTYELVLFAHKLEADKAMTQGAKGIRTIHRPNVFNYNRPTGNERMHNAAKPVPLVEEFLGNSTDAGQVVWDPCCGSGSTMIAAEKIGRRALMGEIDPKNAQIAIERWQKVTGEKAKKLA